MYEIITGTLCYGFATCKMFVLSVFSSGQGDSVESRSLVIKDVLLISLLKVRALPIVCDELFSTTKPYTNIFDCFKQFYLSAI